MLATVSRLILPMGNNLPPKRTRQKRSIPFDHALRVLGEARLRAGASLSTYSHWKRRGVPPMEYLARISKAVEEGAITLPDDPGAALAIVAPEPEPIPPGDAVLDIIGQRYQQTGGEGPDWIELLAYLREWETRHYGSD